MGTTGITPGPGYSKVIVKRRNGAVYETYKVYLKDGKEQKKGTGWENNLSAVCGREDCRPVKLFAAFNILIDIERRRRLSSASA
jgi:hypothetical protein